MTKFKAAILITKHAKQWLARKREKSKMDFSPEKASHTPSILQTNVDL